MEPHTIQYHAERTNPGALLRGSFIFKSGFLPRLLGLLLMVDCAAVLVWFLQFFLWPAYPAIAVPCYAVSAVAEFSLTLWLLLMGAKEKPPLAPGVS